MGGPSSFARSLSPEANARISSELEGEHLGRADRRYPPGDALENGVQTADLHFRPVTGEMFTMGKNGETERDLLEGKFTGMVWGQGDFEAVEARGQDVDYCAGGPGGGEPLAGGGEGNAGEP